MPFSPESLTAERARIFRITHVDNIPWILEKGIYCPASGERDPAFVSIGNADLIAKRTSRGVPIPPRGTLSDYVPFYFTPFSPMLYNIKTGRSVVQRPMNDIAILHTTLPRLQEADVSFVFTDKHAYLRMARFSSSLDDLDRIDWSILQRRDFARDPEDLDKMDRYQAEALVHQQLPLAALDGIACWSGAVKARIEREVANAGLKLRVTRSPSMFFE